MFFLRRDQERTGRKPLWARDPIRLRRDPLQYLALAARYRSIVTDRLHFATGLAGILLAHGLLDDRPLMTGARRVAAGHRLRMPHQEPLREVEVFEFAGTAPPAGETFADTVERIDAELIAAV